jgi:hypothetical protein
MTFVVLPYSISEALNLLVFTQSPSLSITVHPYSFGTLDLSVAFTPPSFIASNNVFEITWNLIQGAWAFKELESFNPPCSYFAGVNLKELYYSMADGSQLPFWLSFSSSPVGLRASYLAEVGDFKIIVRFIYDNNQFL